MHIDGKEIFSILHRFEGADLPAPTAARIAALLEFIAFPVFVACTGMGTNLTLPKFDFFTFAISLNFFNFSSSCCASSTYNTKIN